MNKENVVDEVSVKCLLVRSPFHQNSTKVHGQKSELVTVKALISSLCWWNCSETSVVESEMFQTEHLFGKALSNINISIRGRQTEEREDRGYTTAGKQLWAAQFGFLAIGEVFDERWRASICVRFIHFWLCTIVSLFCIFNIRFSTTELEAVAFPSD